jgi:hypothetical protein
MRSSFTLTLLAVALGSAGAGAQQVDAIRDSLFALEAESHQQWLRGETAALESLMDEEFLFVAMNGAVETKDDVVRGPSAGRTGPRPLHVSSLRAEPQRVVVRGTAAVVISLLHIDATIRGRPLPELMRVLSVFTRGDENEGWVLTARSITPIVSPPASGTATPATR